MRIICFCLLFYWVIEFKKYIFQPVYFKVLIQTTLFVGFYQSKSSNLVIFNTPHIDVVLFDAVPEAALINAQ
jgi:hypothetical protein